MAAIPFTYLNNTPVIDPSLLPLQLALANYMALGNPLAFAPNTRFLQALKIYADSQVLSPVAIDPATGLPRVPDISADIVGIYYLVRGDDVWVWRRAEDCGPDENRYEAAYLGKRTDIATGTWVYYGPTVGAGRIASGSYLAGGDGGPNSPTALGNDINDVTESVSIAGDANNGDGGNGGNGNGDGNGGTTATC